MELTGPVVLRRLKTSSQLASVSSLLRRDNEDQPTLQLESTGDESLIRFSAEGFPRSRLLLSPVSRAPARQC